MSLSGASRAATMNSTKIPYDNPVLSPFYERLIAKGKPPKVALIAVLRRFVVFANAVLKSGQPWRGATVA